MPAAIRNLVDANRALAISQEKSLMIRRWIILQFVECGHDVNRHLTGAYGTRIFSLLAPKVDEEFEELFTGADKDLKEPAIKCLINEAGSDHKYGENQRSVKPRPASSTAQDLARLPAFEPGLDITHDTSRRLVQLPSPDTLEDSSNAMSFKPNDIFLIATRIGTKERSEVALNQIRVDHSDATFEITDQQFEKWMMFLEEDIRLDLSREEILHVHHGTTAKIGRVRNLTALFGRLNGSVKEIHFTVAKVKDPGKLTT